MEFGLLGRTLSHSFSAAYFTKKFADENRGGFHYQNIELPAIDALPGWLQAHPKLAGFNVTIPYKQDVLPYLTASSNVVKAVGACNCVKRAGDTLHGYNTDVIGFRKAFEPLLKAHHQKALILGTGGAAKAVAFVLTQLHIPYHFVSRKAGLNTITYDQLSADVLFSHYIIINTTPLGTYPDVNVAPRIPYSLLLPYHFLMDLVYNPPKTQFMHLGEEHGCQVANGYQMLVEQAEASWRLWMGEDVQQ